jgi:thiol-disulfide isomerase/thioredoxin
MSTEFRPRKIFGKIIHVSDISLETKTHKTLVFFLGAEFCPFCAVERWAIVEALKKFGNWENLVENFSADKDEEYLNIPTFSFLKAKFSSSFVEFHALETADRDFNAIDNRRNDPYDILENYNPDHIVPFILIDGQYMQVGCGYSPKLFEDLDHKKIKEQFHDLHFIPGSMIKNEASYLTALICSTLKDKIEVICTDERINSLLDAI